MKMCPAPGPHNEVEFLDGIGTNSLLFPVTSTALPWDFLSPIPRNLLQVSTVQLLYTVEEKGGKADKKPYPLPYGLGNP